MIFTNLCYYIKLLLSTRPSCGGFFESGASSHTATPIIVFITYHDLLPQVSVTAVVDFVRKTAEVNLSPATTMQPQDEAGPSP
jgi:hypothetical protein